MEAAAAAARSREGRGPRARARAGAPPRSPQLHPRLENDLAAQGVRDVAVLVGEIEQLAHALLGGPARRPQPRAGSISTPGFRIPCGSGSALAARRALANASGRWRSYHGLWSRPTAWWWVIVPPAARTASDAAAFTASHCSSSPPRTAGASIVK